MNTRRRYRSGVILKTGARGDDLPRGRRDSARSRVRSASGVLPFQLREGRRSEGTSAARTRGWLLRVRMWGIDAGERHRNALTAGDLVLVYLGAPQREFIGRAELGSAVHDWTPSEAQVYPGDSPSGVVLADVEEWDPPVPIDAVLSQIDPAEGARADFEARVLRITPNEYETTLAVAAGRALPTD